MIAQQQIILNLVEDSTFDTNTGPFTFAISRKQATVDDDGVTNTTS